MISATSSSSSKKVLRTQTQHPQPKRSPGGGSSGSSGSSTHFHPRNENNDRSYYFSILLYLRKKVSLSNNNKKLGLLSSLLRFLFLLFLFLQIQVVVFLYSSSSSSSISKGSRISFIISNNKNNNNKNNNNIKFSQQQQQQQRQQQEQEQNDNHSSNNYDTLVATDDYGSSLYSAIFGNNNELPFDPAATSNIKNNKQTTKNRRGNSDSSNVLGNDDMLDSSVTNNTKISDDRNYRTDEITDNKDDEKLIHIVFSTGCSKSQDWQSYLLFYSIYKTGQNGNVTRIVSGCTNEKQRKRVETEFYTQVVPSFPDATKKRFHIHFTPNYSKLHLQVQPSDPQKSYNFFNKPFALRHWMENVLGYKHHYDTNNIGKANTADQQRQVIKSIMDNTIIIILDPDQILLKPFKIDYTDDPTMRWVGFGSESFQQKQQEQQQQDRDIDDDDEVLAMEVANSTDFSSFNITEQQDYYEIDDGVMNDISKIRSETPSILQIRKGYPFSQQYGLGADWVANITKVISDMLSNLSSNTNMTIPLFEFFNGRNTSSWNGTFHYKSFDYMIRDKDFYSNRTNWLLNITDDFDFVKYYNAGPPYIGIGSDMYNIIKVWSDIVVPVFYVSDKAHLAEMYSYSIAAAYLGYKHYLAYSFMASDPGMEWYQETWGNDTLIQQNDTYYIQWSNPTYDYNNNNNYRNHNNDDNNNENNHPAVPYILHYCQEYSLGPYHFFKYFLPNDLLSCSHPLLLEPTSMLVAPDDDHRHSTLLTSTKSSREECGKIAFQYNTSYDIRANVHKNISNQYYKKQHAFALCHVLYLFNDALQFWKQRNCNTINIANYNRTWTIPQLQQMATMNERKNKFSRYRNKKRGTRQNMY